MREFGAFLLVGPGATELRRVRDLMDSLRRCEPTRGQVLLVADRQPGLHDLARSRGQWSPVDVIDHPVKNAGRGTGMVNAGVLQALRWIARNHRTEAFWLKLDTDSLVIGPFARRLRQFFSDHPEAGMVGSYSRWPDGSPRPYQAWHAGVLRTMSRRIGLWPSWLDWRDRLWLSAGRNHRKRVAVLRAARAAGYRDGDHCQGGGYALSSEAVQAIAARGWLDDPRLYRRTALGEDVMVAMMVAGSGGRLLDFNKPGEVFAVQWRGLPGSPEALVEAGYAVTHSLKSWQGSDEWALRERFLRLREGPSP